MNCSFSVSSPPTAFGSRPKSEYFNNFGRFYFEFGPGAGGPDPGRPFTIYIDEIKFYHDDGSVGGQVHVGGQDDAGFDGQFIPDSVSVASPLPPPGTVTAVPANSIDLSWSAVTGAVGYNVYRSTITGTGYVKINGTPVTGTTYVDKNTTPGTTYYYVVTSLNSSGIESAYSPEAFATEPANQAPAITSFTAVLNPAKNPHKKINFSVQATDPDGNALTYTIKFGDGSSDATGSTATHAYSTKGTYTAITTVNDSHDHSVSQSLQVTVNDQPPGKVQGVAAN